MRETLPRDYPNIDIRPVVYACVRGAWRSVATVADVRALVVESAMEDDESYDHAQNSDSDQSSPKLSGNAILNHSLKSGAKRVAIAYAHS